jgi:hypothetical protein
MLALLGMAFFTTTLDGTSLLTALPSLEGHLGLTAGQVRWCVTIYGLALGGELLAFGPATTAAPADGFVRGWATLASLEGQPA